MSETLETLRQRLSQDMGDYESGTTTSAGAADGTTLVSTDLKARFLTDDTCNGQWVLVTSGNDDGKERQISDFTQSNGTVTVDTAFTGQIASAITFEIHRFQPSLKKNWINRAIRASYPYFLKEWNDLTLVSNDYLPNSDFEDWASAAYPDYWTNVGSGCTVTENTTAAYLWSGASSIKIVRASGSGAAISIDEDDWPQLLDLEGCTVDFAGYIYTATASAARLQIYSADAAGNATTTSSNCHTGGGKFEKLTNTDASIQADAVTVAIRLNIEAAATVYFDKCALFGPDVYEYVLPTGLKKLNRVFLGIDWDKRGYTSETRLFGCQVYSKNGINYLRTDRIPDAEHKIRLHGYGYFPALSSDSDTLTLDDARVETILKGARAYLLRAQSATIKGSDASRFREESEDIERDFKEELKRQAMAISAVQMPITTDDGRL